MPYKTLLFDLDDTLVIERAAESASFLAACECVRELGGDPENASRAVQETAREFWEALPVWPWCDGIGISPWEGLWGDFSGEGEQLGLLRSTIGNYRKQVWRTGLERAGIRNAGTVERAERTYREERARRHEVYPGVHETLSALRERFILVLLTNGAPGVQREKTVRPGLTEYFHHTVISGEIGFGKPDRRIFGHALERTGASPEEALMAGDNPIRDVAGARRCGIGTVWVNYPGAPFPGEGRPDFEIRVFPEILNIIDR
ncbi:MAG: HAD family hydrolase [Candidatus Latescibacterota bacterium]